MANLKTAADYEQAIATQPQLLSNYWHLGLLHLLAENIDAAQAVWLSGMIQLNDVAELTELLHLLQTQAKQQLSVRPDLAEALYQQALEIAAEPEQAELWLGLGQAVALQGRLEEAIGAWQQAIDLSPAWADPHQQQAEVWQRLGAFIPAVAAYQKASASAPNWQTAYRLGICWGQLQQWQAAAEAFEVAAEQADWIQADLGFARLRLGELAAALTCFQSALAAAPEFVSALQSASPRRAELLATIGQPDGAERFVSLLPTQPSNPTPELLLSQPPPTGCCETQMAVPPDCYWSLEPASVIHLKPPQTLEEQIHFSFRFGRQVALPAAFVAQIPQGRIWTAADLSSRAVFANHQLLSDLSVEFPLLCPGSPQKPHSAQSRWLPEPEQIQGRVVALAGLSDDNYFHWMFELLPQIELLRRSGLDWNHVDAIRVSHSQPFQQQTLALLGVPLSKLLPHQPHLQASELIVASAGHPAWMPSWSCQFLRRLLLSDAQPAHLRLYISRQEASRSLINEAAVLAILEPLGFQTVLLESLSVQQQANLLAQAEAVIAPHGGGLTNLVFCQPGTKVIELFPPDFVYPCYWLIANLVQLEYYYLLGQTPVGYYLTQLLYPNPRLADIWVDLEQLKAILQIAGLS